MIRPECKKTGNKSFFYVPCLKFRDLLLREEVGGGGRRGEGLVNLFDARTHLTFILVDIFL